MSESLLHASRELRRQFEEVIESHRGALWRYCRMLTGSPWDAEDLFQETLLKAFASLAQLWQPLVPKAFLFRIASNTWIDQCRKRKLPLDSADEGQLAAPETMDRLEVAEVMETLWNHLPPKQLVVFLLMVGFDFTAAEVAGMIRATEGSVYAALHRARQNIVKIRPVLDDRHGKPMRQPAAVQSILQALNSGDPAGFVRLLSDQMHNDAAPGFQEYTKDDISTGSLRGFAEGRLQASLRTLWGREVVVVLERNERGEWELHNISAFEWDEEQVVLQKSYYFCKELLVEAGKLLNIPIQLNKPAVDW